MKSYYHIMPGAKSIYINECPAGNFIGADINLSQYLTKDLPDNWREFNKKFIPISMKNNPGKSKIGAGETSRRVGAMDNQGNNWKPENNEGFIKN